MRPDFVHFVLEPREASALLAVQRLHSLLVLAFVPCVSCAEVSRVYQLERLGAGHESFVQLSRFRLAFLILHVSRLVVNVKLQAVLPNFQFYEGEVSKLIKPRLPYSEITEYEKRICH